MKAGKGCSAKKREYMISLWHGGEMGGVSPLFRTQDRGEWVRQIGKLAKEYGINGKLCRVVRREGLDIFSFPNRGGRQAWIASGIRISPGKVQQGFPEGVGEGGSGGR